MRDSTRVRSVTVVIMLSVCCSCFPAAISSRDRVSGDGQLEGQLDGAQCVLLMLTESGNRSPRCAPYITMSHKSNNNVASELSVLIRRIDRDDILSIINLFQIFDREKYHDELEPDEERVGVTRGATVSRWSSGAATSSSREAAEATMAKLRVDEKGGIYLNPLLDSINEAYFKCYVAQDMVSGCLLGYILYFHTLDERSGRVAHGAADDPVAVIEDLYVRPEYRKRGIGTQLFRKVLKSSIERGCSSCELLLVPSSPSGLAFWRRRVGASQVDEALHNNNNNNNNSHEENNEFIVKLSPQDMARGYMETALSQDSSV